MAKHVMKYLNAAHLTTNKKPKTKRKRDNPHLRSTAGKWQSAIPSLSGIKGVGMPFISALFTKSQGIILGRKITRKSGQFERQHSHKQATGL